MAPAPGQRLVWVICAAFVGCEKTVVIPGRPGTIIDFTPAIGQVITSQPAKPGLKTKMSTATPVEKIRLAISEQLVQFGLQNVESLHETILIRNGLFCGRKFQGEGHEVVWFLEEDEIKFFSPCGDLLKATSAIAFMRDAEERRSAPERRAA